uniref:Uncharacterized protein n=1 Tax=Anopheles atroparvus TaxID=41427 RepID=A0AAG5D310_ANOAO
MSRDFSEGGLLPLAADAGRESSFTPTLRSAGFSDDVASCCADDGREISPVLAGESGRENCIACSACSSAKSKEADSLR